MNEEELKRLNKSLTKKEKEFLKKIVDREIGNAVIKIFETINRFAQHKLRDLETRGVIFGYTSEVRRERDGWVMCIKASVPDWLVEELALSKAHYIAVLRRLRYRIRAAERYLARIPGMSLDWEFVPLLADSMGDEAGEFLDEDIEVEIVGAEDGRRSTRDRGKGSREAVEGDGEGGGAPGYTEGGPDSYGAGQGS